MAETTYFRIYAEGRPGEWEAICLDLDIAAQGPTFEAAIASLRGSVELYLEELHQLPENERQKFLNRKVPLSLRVKFLWHAFRLTFSNRDNGNPKERAEFLMPCRA